MLRYLLPIAIFTVLIWFFARGLQLDPSYVPSPLIGKSAPEFSLPQLQDPEATLSHMDLKGEYALLNVWATWCSGCYEDHPFLLELAQSDTIPIYGLNWKDDREAALTWLRQLGDPYEAVGFDELGEVAIDWGVYGAPETFLVATDGTVVYKHLSPLTQGVWEREFIPRIQSRAAED